VSVRAKTLLPGHYNGQITISAGGAIQNNHVNIPVTLTVV
jgi:hypothetical protein